MRVEMKKAGNQAKRPSPTFILPSKASPITLEKMAYLTLFASLCNEDKQDEEVVGARHS